MFHQVFDSRIEGKTKRIGILGETHLYNFEESCFAKEELRGYSCLGIEKAENYSLLKNLLYIPASIVAIPSFLALEAVAGRSETTNLKDYAESKGIKVVNLDKYIGAGKLVLLPFFIAATSLYKIPMMIIKGRQGEEKSDREGDEHLTKGTYPPSFGNFGLWLLDVKKRDENMAMAAVRHLKNSRDNILINCGAAHVPGIRRNLERMTDSFRLVRTERCLPFEFLASA